MNQDSSNSTDRRTFLQAGALGRGLGRGGGAPRRSRRTRRRPRRPSSPSASSAEPASRSRCSTRGPSGARRTERVLRFSYASGVRVFDTAKVYGTEPTLKKWFEAAPDVRKNIFLITKDMPKVADQIPAMVDDRLKSLGVDHIDLFFIHGLGDDHPLDEAIRLIKSKELGKVVDSVKKSGKIKHFGFSSHHKSRAPIIEAAAEGGIVDAIMLQYTPWLDKESPLNKALDAAWKKNIGLISMKQIAGNMFGDRPKGNILEDVVKKKVPMLKERKLSPFQGLLHAIWTDERISTVCVSMKNTDQIRENVEASRNYEPVKVADLRQLRDAVLAQGPTLCADCDGRCSLAAGTKAELGNLTRFLTYHEHHGLRTEARREYAALSPEARDWSDADLESARAACPSGLDFASLLREAERHLA